MKRAANTLLVLAVVGAGCRPAHVTTHPGAALPAGMTDVTVPLAVGAHSLFVRARANGRDAGYFFLDTGAPITMIDRGLARKLWLPRYRKGRLSGVGGSQTFWSYKLGQMTVGGLTLGRHAVAAADLSALRTLFGAEVRGVLGSPLFSAVPFTIDYREATITFHRRAGFSPPAGAATLPMQVRGRKPHVKATINGKHEGWFLLDTGTTAGLTINQAFAKAKRLKLQSRYVYVTSGPIGRAAHGSAVVGSLEILGHKFTDALCSMAPGGKDGAAAGSIGAGILKHFRVTLNYSQGRLYAEHRPPEPVEQLAARGGLEAKDFLGYTPLTLAAAFNETDRARNLIARGADLNAKNNRHMTPLTIAAFHAALETAHVLIEGGADVTAAAEDGTTPLAVAAYGGDENLVQALLAAGARVNVACDTGYTPLMAAVEGGHASVVKLLIKHGANLNARDKQGRTALQRARGGGHQDVIRALCQAGARR